MFGLNYGKKKMLGVLVLSIPLVIYYYSLRKQKDNLDNKIKEHEHEDEQQEEADDINLWSELDVNLLGEILNRLCLTDQARFRAVCKNWLSAPPVNAKKSLPWYLSFDSSLTPVTRQFQLQLYDTSSPDLASVQKISLTRFGIPYSSYMQTKAILRHNWLLICIGQPRWFFWTRRYFLYFSPFTRKIITLPKLDSPHRFKFVTMFSTQPDSPDCVFFLLDTCHDDKIYLLTYRSGDKEWTANQFNTVPNFLPCTCDLVCIRGMLYIVSPCGQLASYNIVDGEFKFELLLVDVRLAQNCYSTRRCKVFELDGELMILFFNSHAKEDATLPGKQCIRRYNRSKKLWSRVSSLGDKALFVNDRDFQIAKINKMDMRNNGVLSNKIYHFIDGGYLIYSIDDGELVEFKYVSSNLSEGGAGDLHGYKNNYGPTISDTNETIYWLRPPSIRVCSPQTTKEDY